MLRCIVRMLRRDHGFELRPLLFAQDRKACFHPHLGERALHFSGLADVIDSACRAVPRSVPSDAATYIRKLAATASPGQGTRPATVSSRLI